eukprot:Platyproteum_vivax@DN14536_c0_g1_i1.p1
MKEGVTTAAASAAAGGAGGGGKKRTFKTFQYRGIPLEKLLDLKNEDLMDLFPARQRRKYQRGVGRQVGQILKKLRVQKKLAPYGEKPKAVNTHMRNITVIPEMIGSVVGVYN